MQPCLPLEEELVKVPTGHDRKNENVSLPVVFLNPEAKRTRIKVVPQRPSWTAIASSFEFCGFL